MYFAAAALAKRAYVVGFERGKMAGRALFESEAWASLTYSGHLTISAPAHAPGSTITIKRLGPMQPEQGDWDHELHFAPPKHAQQIADWTKLN